MARVLATAGARVSTAVGTTRTDGRAARRGTVRATTTRGGAVTRAGARDGFTATKEESEGRMSERELVAEFTVVGFGFVFGVDVGLE